jgi:predicted transcriptional regulator YdeE
MDIVEKQGFTLVGIPVHATWQELFVEMPKAWQRFRARYGEIPHRQNETFCDASLDTSDETYRQLIGVRVTRIEALPEGMQVLRVPAQRYLHFHHEGPVQGIADSFGRMHDWAEQHGLEIGEFKLDFGYQAEGDGTHHDLYVELLP